MALIGSGAENYPYIENGSITDLLQEELARKMYTNENTGTEIENITTELNNHVPTRNGYKFKTKAFTIYSYSKALNYISASLREDAVPVIRVIDTRKFGYYNGAHYKHYMVVEAVDYESEVIRVVDPNNQSNSFFGVKYVTFKEFEDLILYGLNKNGEHEDLWVSVYTNDTLDPWHYVY